MFVGTSLEPLRAYKHVSTASRSVSEWSTGVDDGIMAAASMRRPSSLSESQMRELTGLSQKQFADLLARVGPEWVAERETR